MGLPKTGQNLPKKHHGFQYYKTPMSDDVVVSVYSISGNMYKTIGKPNHFGVQLVGKNFHPKLSWHKTFHCSERSHSVSRTAHPSAGDSGGVWGIVQGCLRFFNIRENNVRAGSFTWAGPVVIECFEHILLISLLSRRNQPSDNPDVEFPICNYSCNLPHSYG